MTLGDLSSLMEHLIQQQESQVHQDFRMEILVVVISCLRMFENSLMMMIDYQEMIISHLIRKLREKWFGQLEMEFFDRHELMFVEVVVMVDCFQSLFDLSRRIVDYSSLVGSSRVGPRMTLNRPIRRYYFSLQHY